MQLDDDSLRRIRDAIAAVRADGGVPRAALARLGDALPTGVGMTIDFSTASVLGHPLVVLRPSERAEDPTLALLTPREREVAGLVATGLRNKAVAIALGITVATVKDHVHRILTKTGVDSRAGVAALWRD